MDQFNAREVLSARVISRVNYALKTINILKKNTKKLRGIAKTI